MGIVAEGDKNKFKTVTPSINLKCVAEYAKDIEKLSGRRFRHLESDLEIVYAVLKTHPESSDSTNYKRIPCGKEVTTPIYKLRKIKSTDARDTRTLRLTYAVNQYTNEIIPIEIYSKSDKENHDQMRILKYFRSN
jgi:hypothetical protein